jgi:hypothetical protein
MARKCRHADFFDGLTRPSMRLLVRIYVSAGAPHGLTVDGLARYWRARLHHGALRSPTTQA